MNWQDYTSTPLWQQSDDAEKEHLRYRYWKDYLAPNIPEEHHREARTLFDQHTRRRGNPKSSYAADLWDVLWHGGYAGAADLVSGASRLVGGDGQRIVQMNSLNRLFHFFNWQHGDDGKKRPRNCLLIPSSKGTQLQIYHTTLTLCLSA